MGDLVGSRTVRDFVEAHAVARPGKREQKQERWQEIVAQAVRQSGRPTLPVLHPPLPLSRALEQVQVVAHNLEHIQGRIHTQELGHNHNLDVAHSQDHMHNQGHNLDHIRNRVHNHNLDNHSRYNHCIRYSCCIRYNGCFHNLDRFLGHLY